MIFSVVIPTFNRLESLKRTVQSVLAQDFPQFELIVVNDGGSDGTDSYLTGLASKGMIKYHSHPNSGLAATRRAGLQYAAGEYVAFTDDDCVLPADWLKKYHEIFQNSNVGVIGGATRTGDPSNPCADANDFINNYFKARINTDPRNTPYLTGNNIAFRRLALMKVGGPDPEFRMGAEDRDLVFRLERSGEKIIFVPDIVIDHYNNATLRGFVRHQYVQGRGSHAYYASTKGRAGARPKPIPVKIYLGLLFAPFGSRRPLRALALFSLIIIAQVAVTAGFIRSVFAGKGDQKREVRGEQ